MSKKISCFGPKRSEQLFSVSEDERGLRLDRFLSLRLPALSRSRIQAVIKSGDVLRNGQALRSSEPVRSGDTISWHDPAIVACETAVAEDLPLTILYEDADLLVLNKPAGLVVHPGAGHLHGTLVSALLHHCGSLSLIGGVERPGIVHRLDKETSGCLVVAKNDVAHQSLAAQFANRTVRKTYLAVVDGKPKPSSGVLDLPIARHAVHRQKMAIAKNDRGRSAVTEYKTLATNGLTSLVECHPRTGRTHQIRVHLKHLGCPVAGDRLYGRRGQATRHLLHAWKLSFLHPVTGLEAILRGSASGRVSIRLNRAGNLPKVPDS